MRTVPSIYSDLKNVPSKLRGRLSQLASELQTVETLLLMGYNYCNHLNLIDHKHVLQTRIAFMEKALGRSEE